MVRVGLWTAAWRRIGAFEMCGQPGPLFKETFPGGRIGRAGDGWTLDMWCRLAGLMADATRCFEWWTT
jgi:hypothetical protein